MCVQYIRACECASASSVLVCARVCVSESVSAFECVSVSTRECVRVCVRVCLWCEYVCPCV